MSFGLRSGPQAAKGVEVPSFSLPDDASFEQLRKQAKDLRDLAGAGVPGALELVAANHPQGPHAVEQQAYYRAAGDRISFLRVMCSGYRPLA